MGQCEPFQFAWGLGSGHLQTVWPTFFRQSRSLNRTRERLETEDGDFFDVDWFGPQQAPIVVLLHGLAGSSSSTYIIGLQQALSQKGFRTAALNFRGCSGEINRKAGGYHAGFTHDLSQLYETIRAKQPLTPIGMIGFSLGGNSLLKWLGEQGGKIDLFAAMAVSVPFKLSVCADRLDRGLSKLYRNHLVGQLKSTLKKKQAHLHASGQNDEATKIEQLGSLGAVRSFWEFDDQVVAPLNGFNGVDDYYQQSSSFHFLENIEVPTLLVQADDDPFLLSEFALISDCLSGSTRLETTRGGGHVGFVSGSLIAGVDYWIEKRAADFLMEQLKKESTLDLK